MYIIRSQFGSRYCTAKYCIQRIADIVSTQRAMSRFTADTLQAKYGDKLGQPPLSDAGTPRMLRKALLAMTPPLDVSDGIFYFGITHIVQYRTVHERGLAAP